MATSRSRACVPREWLFSCKEVRVYYAWPREVHENVAALRDKAATFILKVALAGQIPQVAISSACTFFHRFYIRRNFKSGKPLEIAATCLFIACKTEEALQKIDKFSACVSNIAAKGDAVMAEQNRARWKRIILEYEPIVCEALAFDLYVAHPHRIMLSYLDSVNANRNVRIAAYRLFCDRLRRCARCSLRLPLCLCYQPHVISAAFISLAMRLTGIPIPDPDDGEKWWQKLEVTREELEEIAQEYLQNQNAATKTLVKSLSINLPPPLITTSVYSPSISSSSYAPASTVPSNPSSYTTPGDNTPAQSTISLPIIKTPGITDSTELNENLITTPPNMILSFSTTPSDTTSPFTASTTTTTTSTSIITKTEGKRKMRFTEYKKLTQGTIIMKPTRTFSASSISSLSDADSFFSQKFISETSQETTTANSNLLISSFITSTDNSISDNNSNKLFQESLPPILDSSPLISNTLTEIHQENSISLLQLPQIKRKREKSIEEGEISETN